MHPLCDAIERFRELGAIETCEPVAVDLAFDARRVDHEGGFPADVMAEAAKQGLFGLMARGLSPMGMAATARELARMNGSLAMMLCAHNGLAMHPLLHHASPQLRDEVMPAVTRGDALLCFALTEPLAGNDLASLGTTVVWDGEQLRISGEKCFITNAGRARYAVVVARSPQQGPISLVLVDLHAPGVTRSAEEDKLGLRGVSNVRLRFDEVVLPRHHLIGEPGKGWELAQEALQLGRTLVAAGSLGAADGAIAITRAYLDERHRYGKPLAAIPIVRAHVARAEAQRLALETLVRCAAHSCGRVSAWSAIAKVACTETSWQIVDTMLGLHGGLGFMEPTGLARYLRDGRASRIFEGPNDILRLRLAMEYVLVETPAAPPLRSRFAEALVVDHAIANVLAAGARMRSTYRLGLVKRQADCIRLADATIELAAAIALLARFEAGGTATEDARCRLFCRMAATRAMQLVGELESRADALTEEAF